MGLNMGLIGTIYQVLTSVVPTSGSRSCINLHLHSYESKSPRDLADQTMQMHCVCARTFTLRFA